MSINLPIQDFGLTGYLIIFKRGYIAVLMAPNRTKDEPLNFWNPLAEELKSKGVNITYTAVGDDAVPSAIAKGYYITWMGMLGSIVAEPNGLPAVIGSRLVSRSTLTAPNTIAVYDTVKTVLNERNVLLLPYPSSPGKSYMDRAWDYGVNPAWRTTAMHLVAITYRGSD
jgi:hypothetical protein